jgi:peptidoglycan hydrolase-like protein with peptidoglycan-binding domain
MAVRPYTGNKDAVHAAKREGTQVLANALIAKFGLKNLGIFSDRAVKGSANPNPPKSVHATWRAVDLGGNPDQLKAVIGFLFDNRDALGIEEIHDYSSAYMANPKGWGAGYRCDRDQWKVYDKNTIGSPGGKWVHYEISPAMADNPDAVRRALEAIGAGAPAPAAPTPSSNPTPPSGGGSFLKYPGTPIQRGSKGDAVKLVQNVVGANPQDGDFGPGTEGKVKAWQKANGLKDDGVVGPMTWNKMFP